MRLRTSRKKTVNLNPMYVQGILGLLLIVVVIMLIMIFIKLSRPRPVGLTLEVDAAINRLKAGIEHTVHVSAVLKLIEQIDQNPDSLELIKSYPETVRAAAWVHHINLLGGDLQSAQQRLSHAHRGTGPFAHYSNRQDFIKYEQQQVDAIRTKLDAAIKASGQSGLRVVT